MPLVEPIKIENLRELQSALKQLDGESQKQIRVVFNEAAEIIVEGARRLVPRGPSGDARASLKAMSGQREAKVVGGGRKAPYYPWLDFGGRVGRGRTGLNTGSVHRKFIESGRYIYPTLSRNRQEILETMAEGLARAARDAGLEVT